MAVVTFSKKDVEKSIKLTKENLDIIQLMGIPITLKEEEIHIEVLPNRPDLLSLQGFVRAIKTFFAKQGLKKYKVNVPERGYKVIVDSSVKDIRPYTVCAIIKDLKFNDSLITNIIDVQEKLHSTWGRNRKKVAIGIYPLEKISLPIRYLARKPEEIKFIPLGYENEMTGKEILEIHPKGKEYSHLLQENKKYPIFIDNKNKILSMPPIINSNETGKIDEKTKEIFIECSGNHLPTLQKTLAILTTMFADMNGKIFSMEIEDEKKFITPNLSPTKIKISLEQINSILGLNLKERDIEKLLSKMGYGCKNLNVQIPAWRTDILHPIDIIEDIAIAYGYENFIPAIPNISTIGEESKESKFKEKLSELIIGLGMLEISSYHLIKAEEIDKNESIQIQNAKTEYKILRPNLIISMLRILSENKDHTYPQNLFEIGKVFTPSNKSISGVNEEEKLIISCSPSNFTELKSILVYIGQQLEIIFDFKEENNNYLINGRSAGVYLEGTKIGYLGEVSPEKLNKFGIRMPVSLLEISLEKISKKTK